MPTSNKLAERKFRRSEEIETVVLPNGIHLLKQTRTAEYLAADDFQQSVFEQLDGNRTVQEVLQKLLAEGKRPRISDFYDLILTARDKGFLEDADPESDAPPLPERRGDTWPFGWGLNAAIALSILSIPPGLLLLRRCHPVVPTAFIDWIMVLLLLSIILTLASLVQGFVLSGYRRQVYGLSLRWNLGIPYVGIDPRDAFMAGRRCEIAVALQALAVPFAALAASASGNWDVAIFAATLGALILACPFGQTPAHRLVHALFRKSYQLPRHAATFLGKKVLHQVFFSKMASAEEEYLLSYSTYAIAWLGFLISFTAGILRRQGHQIVQDFLFAPNLPVRIMSFIVLGLVAVLLFAPVLYQLWLVARNAYTVLAPRCFRAETRLRKHAATGKRPSDSIVAQFLSETLLFRDLPSPALEALAHAMSFIAAPAKATIIREGDPGESLFIIYSGQVSVQKEDEAGRPHEVAELESGEAFGEIALLENAPRNATVVAQGETELLILDKAEFDELLLKSLGADAICTTIQVCAFLKRNELFAQLNDQDLQRFAHDFVQADFATGDALIRTGEVHNTFFIVYEGEVEILRDGKRLNKLSIGDFFGEAGLLRGQPANADVIALTDGHCFKLSKASFLSFVSSDLHAGLAVEAALEARLPAQSSE